jgi:hypothetical protein
LLEVVRVRTNVKLNSKARTPAAHWIFPDPAVTVAAIDRLVHHSTIIEINTESYCRRTAAERTATTNKARAKLPA